MAISALSAKAGCRGALARAGTLLVAVAAVLLAGCAKPAPAEPTIAYFQGAIAVDHLALDKPAPMGDSPGGGFPELAAAAPTQSMGPAPKFDVVAQRTNDRRDRQTTYYVVIAPLDQNTDAFKITVKRVLAALAENNGGPMFSASIWDHLAAAQTEVSYRSNPDLFSEDLLKAREAFNNQHLVANYVGGMAGANEPLSYQLFWFPEAMAGNSPMGQWVSAESWKP